jgi:hypothetical protein
MTAIGTLTGSVVNDKMQPKSCMWGMHASMCMPGSKLEHTKECNLSKNERVTGKWYKDPGSHPTSLTCSFSCLGHIQSYIIK